MAALKSVVALIVPIFMSVRSEASSAAFPIEVHYVHIVVFGFAGVWLILGSQDDPRGSYLGAVFLLVAAMFSDRVLDGAIPLAKGAGRNWIGALHVLDPVALSPWFIWCFAEHFPREVPAGRWRAVAATVRWACGSIGGVVFSASVVSALLLGTFRLAGPRALLARDSPFYWIALIVAELGALLMIVLNTRSGTASQQRRVRLFVGGLVLGFVPMAADVLLELAIPPFGQLMNRPQARFLSGVVLYPLLLSVPITTSYAVVVNHALSVRLLIRRAIQYALARATLFFVLAVPFLLFVVYLYSHRTEPILSLVQGTRPIIVTIFFAIGAALFPIRKQLLVALDRHFFREQYDAHSILRTLIEESGATPNIDTLADLIERDIDRALHVKAVTLFTLDQQTGALLSSRQSRRPPLPASAALAVLLRGSNEPLDVALDRRGSALDRLPDVERTWLLDGAFQLLVPIREGSPPILSGLIALGSKRSELPFSSEDRSLLGAIASSCSVVCQNIRLRTPLNSPISGVKDQQPTNSDPGPAQECERCGTLHETDCLECPACKRPLRAAPVPLVLRGSYRLECRVGTGGMGIVFRGTDLNLRRSVAIKTLPEVSPEAVARIRREAWAMAAVSDLHLATIFAVEVWRSTPLLVVEYFEGGTLADRLRRGPLSLREALRVARDVASGLERLHGAGILHRDVKPSNIAFTATGVPKLLDFGVAKLVGADSIDRLLPVDANGTTTIADFDTSVRWPDTRRMIGTPLYLSPECVAHEPADALVDLWALTMVLFESAAGTHPMRAATVFETLARIENGDVPDVRMHVPDCTADFAKFIDAALHRDPSRRPQSARQMAEKLDALFRHCSDPIAASD